MANRILFVLFITSVLFLSSCTNNITIPVKSTALDKIHEQYKLVTDENYMLTPLLEDNSLYSYQLFEVDFPEEALNKDIKTSIFVYVFQKDSKEWKKEDNRSYYINDSERLKNLCLLLHNNPNSIPDSVLIYRECIRNHSNYISRSGYYSPEIIYSYPDSILSEEPTVITNNQIRARLSEEYLLYAVFYPENAKYNTYSVDNLLTRKDLKYGIAFTIKIISRFSIQ